MVAAPALPPLMMAPHSQEAEEAVLGSVLISQGNAYTEVASFLTPDDFFLLRNSWVYEAMQRLAERREPVDYVTLLNELKQQERLDEIGGAAYITYLTSNTPTSMHAETYGRIVHNNAVRRRLLEAAEEITALARQESEDINTTIEQSTRALFKVAQRKNEQAWTPIQTAALGVYDSVEKRHLGQAEPSGISTGLSGLDQFFRLKKARYIVIAGRPGMGKTDALLNLMVNVAKQGKKVGFFSLEMDKDELTYRILSRFCKIDSTRLEDEQLSESEFEKFVAAYTQFNKLRIYIDDEPCQTPMTMLSRARVLAAQRGLDAIFMDYLQLADSGEKTHGETEEVSKVSRGCNQLKKDLNIPVVVAAQLSRAVENRADKRPVMSDIRQSGQIEQDANTILYVYRDEEYNDNSEDKGVMEFGILKNRGGKKRINNSNRVRCYYSPEHHLIGNLEYRTITPTPKSTNLDKARLNTPNVVSFWGDKD